MDAAYISFKKGPVQVTTVRITEDIGPDEEVVGIEILDASKNLDWVSKEPTVEVEKAGSA